MNHQKEAIPAQLTQNRSNLGKWPDRQWKVQSSRMGKLFKSGGIYQNEPFLMAFRMWSCCKQFKIESAVNVVYKLQPSTV